MNPPHLERILALAGPKKHGRYRCPVHDDSDPSLSIRLNRNGKVQVKCFGGCDTVAVLVTWGLGLADLYPPEQRLTGRPKPNGPNKPTRKVVEVYAYGAGIRKLRCLDGDGKKYMPWQVKRGDRWVDSKPGQLPEPGLYRLRELPRQPGVVFVVEGERKVDTLRKLGLAATCPPHGANKWTPEYANLLRQHYLVVLPDNDKAGLRHAERVAEAHPPSRSKTVILPVAEGEDIVDWVKLGGTKPALVALTGLTICEVCGNPIAPARRGFQGHVCSPRCRLTRNRIRTQKVVSPNSGTVVSGVPKSRIAELKSPY